MVLFKYRAFDLVSGSIKVGNIFYTVVLLSQDTV